MVMIMVIPLFGINIKCKFTQLDFIQIRGSYLFCFIEFCFVYLADGGSEVSIELLSLFLASLMEHNYTDALVLCKEILRKEPSHKEGQKFYPLLKEMIKLEAKSSSEEEGTDDSSSEDSSEEDEEEEKEEAG